MRSGKFEYTPRITSVGKYASYESNEKRAVTVVEGHIDEDITLAHLRSVKERLFRITRLTESLCFA